MPFADAKPYEAKAHFNMTGLQLHGGAANQTGLLTCGLSHFLPGGGAERSVSPLEKFYFVLAGEITIVTDDREVTLSVNDSVWLAAGEARSIENRSNEVATMVVVLAKNEANA
ncbi:cupin domain-containing protein [Sphingobium sp.]|uniref:cupin domain-containing protein n=1 Tax=Sphingobium sp. TaxID=1912891 RepID=UPI0028BD9334|nr:cupin domain-containing protein [Sphingobium sp.]